MGNNVRYRIIYLVTYSTRVLLALHFIGRPSIIYIPYRAALQRMDT